MRFIHEYINLTEKSIISGQIHFVRVHKHSHNVYRYPKNERSNCQECLFGMDEDTGSLQFVCLCDTGSYPSPVVDTASISDEVINFFCCLGQEQLFDLQWQLT